jgi:type IV pilus assembly protein PilM
MISLFKTAKPSLIGVDISGGYVKMVELSGVRPNLCVEHYSVEPLPADAYSENTIHDIPLLAETIEKAWRRLGSKTTNVAIAMPSALINTKIFDLPDGLSPAEQFLQVESQALDFVPFGRDEINIDYQVIGAGARENEIRVFIAVTKRQHVEERLAVLETAHLQAKILEIESHAVLHALNEMLPAFPDAGVDRNIMVVDIGTDRSEYLVFRNGDIIHQREHSSSASGLRYAIQSAYHLDLVEADKLILNPDSYHDRFPSYEAEVLQPFLDGVALEIIRQMQAYDTSGPWGDIQHIVLCGSIAGMDGIEDTVRNRIGIDTRVANPMAACSLSPRVPADQLLHDAPSLMIAFGLALRSSL